MTVLGAGAGDGDSRTSGIASAYANFVVSS